jgi:hypothetical protein
MRAILASRAGYGKRTRTGIDWVLPRCRNDLFARWSRRRALLSFTTWKPNPSNRKELDMGSNWSKRVVASLVVLALTSASAVASAEPVHKNYAMNGATGDYTPSVVHKNYSLNGATGDFTPVATAAPAVRVVHVRPDDGFAWGAALVGAAASLLLVLGIGMTGRIVRRRRPTTPSPARPSAA